MRFNARGISAVFLYLAAAISAVTSVLAADTPALKVTPFGAPIYPSVLSMYWLDVSFNPRYLDQQALSAALQRAASNGNWNCTDVNNYSVGITAGKNLKIAAMVLNSGSGSCEEFMGKLISFRLLIPGMRYGSVDAKVTVKILNIKDSNGQPLTIASEPTQVTWKASFVKVSVQSIANEKLNDKTIDQKGVTQAGLKGTFFLGNSANNRGGFYLATKDLFSTNERDIKSLFLGGLGYQYAISRTWYSPLKLEGEMQGNQVATNLSSVASLSMETALPWGWTGQLTGNEYLGHPLSPEFVLGFPYTHRINQVVGAKASPLPADDFAMNPALAFGNGTILHKLCHVSSGGAGADKASAQSGFCAGWDAEVGLWYLPLETTSKGSQRVEGYWDYSFLIPLSNFANIPFVALDSQSQQMQFCIKYEDSVSAANNYARDKKWSFGVELTKK